MSTVIYFIAALLFWVFIVRAIASLDGARRLPGAIDTAQKPRCSVVIAARDEAARIEATVRRILVQEAVEIDVIVVDDRSTDGTGERAQHLNDPRVTVLRVDSLSEGWLGKSHACHLGAMQARGNWILFTDADCWLKPDVIARALTQARAEGVQHVALTPGVVPETVWAAAWHLTFLISLLDWFAAVNRDQPGAHFGMGAFNLIEAETYRECGGYQRLRLTVVDDIKLGRLVRQCGRRTRAFIGGEDAECHWGVTLAHIVRLMEKNYFAALNYNTIVALSAGVGMPFLWAAGCVGFFSGEFLGWAAGFGLALSTLPGMLLARRLKWSVWLGLLVPLIFPVMYYAVLRSTVLTLWRGGIRWRDTFYPLPLLRAGNVR